MYFMLREHKSYFLLTITVRQVLTLRATGAATPGTLCGAVCLVLQTYYIVTTALDCTPYAHGGIAVFTLSVY